MDAAGARADASGRSVAATAHSTGAAQRGIDSVAIAFLHGFRHPAHELRAAALARRSRASRKSSPRTRSRRSLASSPAATPRVADAYLSPVLLRYVAAFRRELRGAPRRARPLLLMQSNGGLVDPDGFRGINSVLSGPAGGVVGMIAAGTAERAAPADRLRHGRHVDRRQPLRRRDCRAGSPTEIDGVRLQAPMMDIHTIAAGGGSIVRFADGRLQVGPDSAGADPGPALLPARRPRDGHRLQRRARTHSSRSAFRPCSAPRATEPLDAGRARARHRRASPRTAGHDGTESRIETLADAFLQVAVARMANAIRELALQHGQDPARFALLRFGGAAGQHACAVAEALGIRRDPAAPAGRRAVGATASGSRSARRASTHRRSTRSMRRGTRAADSRCWPSSRTRRAANCCGRVSPATRIDIRRTAHLRLAGSDTTLEVALAGPPRACAPRSSRRTTACTVSRTMPRRSSSAQSPPKHSSACAARSARAPDARRRDGDAGTSAAATVDGLARRRLARRAAARARRAARWRNTSPGPLLLIEDGATSWIAPGWAGEVAAAAAACVLRARRPSAHTARDRRGIRARPDAARSVQRRCSCTSPSRWARCCARPRVR